MSHPHVFRFSLATVWLVTAAVSIVELDDASTALLQEAGLHDAHLRHGLIWAGAALDAVLGLAMLWRPHPWVWRLAALQVLGFTALATLMTPSQWWHPFGPLLKNLPILALLWALSHQSTP